MKISYFNCSRWFLSFYAEINALLEHCEWYTSGMRALLLCIVLLCLTWPYCVNKITRSGIMWYFHLYYPGLSYWHLGNHPIATVPVRWVWHMYELIRRYRTTIGPGGARNVCLFLDMYIWDLTCFSVISCWQKLHYLKTFVIMISTMLINSLRPDNAYMHHWSMLSLV